MLAAETRGDRPLLERIVQRRLRLEEIAHRQEERRNELPQQQRAGRGLDAHDSLLFLFLLISGQDLRIAVRRRRSRPSPATTAGTPSSPAASADRTDNASQPPLPWRTG